MANRQLFQSATHPARVPAADARNAHGAPAYARDARQALAQYAATGCLANTFYAGAAEELTQVLALADRVPAEFIARTAVYARQRAFMKDMPALLLAVLTARRPDLLERVFDRVIDSPKMLRTYVQIVRSGVTGRRSFGSLPRRLVRQWLESRSDDVLLRASIGQSPSMADIVRMVHPKPQTAARRALYAWMIRRPYAIEDLPAAARAFVDFKAGRTSELPDVPFDMLTSMPDRLTTAHWQTIAARASWQTLRMNLNHLAWHGVFSEPPRIGLWQRIKARFGKSSGQGRCKDKGADVGLGADAGAVKGADVRASADAGAGADAGASDAAMDFTRRIAARLADRREIERARVFSYQLMTTHATLHPRVPAVIREAVAAALEIAIEQVPAIDGQVYVCLDVSGSMRSPITGNRKGATTTVRCVDVAALMAAAIVRRNPNAQVLPFNDRVVSHSQWRSRSRPGEPVWKLAKRLASLAKGGTNCSAPLAQLNQRRARGSLVIYLSDNQSWVDAGQAADGTPLLEQWTRFKQRNRAARLVCIDLQPSPTTQALEREDVLNIGGFSDQVFELIAEFAAGRLHPDHAAGLIDAIDL